eukprot:g33493.t1
MPFKAEWTGKELASALCDGLVADGKLKESFSWRSHSFAAFYNALSCIGLDGAKMATFDNPGPLEVCIRKVTEGEAWVDDVVAGLINMLPESAAHAEKHVEMDQETKKQLAEAHELTLHRQQDKGKRKGGGRGKGKWTDGKWADEGCYHCGGQGHFARDCPDKGSGKGKDWGDKGGGKGYGGGGGKRGKDESCFSCGGSGHFARDCPEDRGKGHK